MDSPQVVLERSSRAIRRNAIRARVLPTTDNERTTLQRTVVDVAGLSAVLDETSALCATQDEFTALFEPDTLDSEELESELDALCLQFPVVPTNALQSKPVSAVRLVTTPV